MREKWQYLEFFWSVISRVRTRKTPNMDTFHAVPAVYLKKSLHEQYLCGNTNNGTVNPV